MELKRKWAVRTFKILLAVEIAWLVLANLFLSTDLAPWAINRKPEKRTITWERAWTLYPTRVYLRGLVFDQRTRTMDVKVTADTAAASVGVLPLVLKRLVLDEIRAGKLSVVLNRRAPDEAAAPQPVKTEPGLRIVLSDIEAEEIERFVFGELEVTGGEARVEGTFDFQVRGEMEVRDAVLDWQGAKMRLADKTVAKSLTLGFRGGLSPFRPKQEKGLATLRKINAEVDVVGDLKRLRPLQVFFAGAKWIERLDGEGDVALHLDLEDGRLRPGSEIDVVATGLELDFLGFEARGSGRVDAEVEDHAGESGRLGEIAVTFDEFSFGRRKQEQPLALGTGLKLVARAPDLGLGEGLQALEVTLDIPASEVPDIAFLGRSLPPGMGVAIDGGSATLNGHLEVTGENEQIEGSLELHGKQLSGSYRGMDFEIDLELVTRLSGEDLDDFEAELTGTELRLFNGVFDNERSDFDEGWWMTISVPEGQTNFAVPLGIEAQVDLSMRDTRVVAALFAEVKKWLRHFEGMLTVRDVRGDVSVTLADQQLSLRELELAGDKLEVLAELELQKGANAGIFWFKYRFLGLALERLGDETEWKLVKARAWYDEQRAESWVSRRGKPIDPSEDLAVEDSPE